jgi:hypothetical protein
MFDLTFSRQQELGQAILLARGALHPSPVQCCFSHRVVVQLAAAYTRPALERAERGHPASWPY